MSESFVTWEGERRPASFKPSGSSPTLVRPLSSFQQIMHYHMQNGQYRQVVEVCELYGEQEACLWEQALGYFAHKEEDCKEYMAAVLARIETKNLMPPLLGEARLCLWGQGADSRR